MQLLTVGFYELQDKKGKHKEIKDLFKEDSK